MNRRQFGASQSRKVCIGSLDHGTDDIDQVKVRIAQNDIDACYDAMYALNYDNSSTPQFDVEVENNNATEANTFAQADEPPSSGTKAQV